MVTTFLFVGVTFLVAIFIGVIVVFFESALLTTDFTMVVGFTTASGFFSIGFDTFEGFPGVSEKDKKTSYSKVGAFKHNYNSYKDIINSVKFFNKNRFLNNKNKILTIKGDAVKTIPKFVQNNKHLVVSSLWLDFDLYEPTKVALDNFLPLIPKGGIVIFDQLNNSMWPGETRAFFEKKIKYSKLKNFNFEPNLCYLIIK